METYTATIEFDRYEEIREALFNGDLSRAFDKRSFAEGNLRDGVVSISHGATQRARRRVENTQFRLDRLKEYERKLFPEILTELLDKLIHDDGRGDLVEIVAIPSIVLSARRAGVDLDASSLEEVRQLLGYSNVLTRSAMILDAKDPQAVRAEVLEGLVGFERDFVRPSWGRRVEAVERHRRGEIAADDLPRDILTVLLLHRTDPSLGYFEDGQIVREVGNYLMAGATTSASTVTNALDFLFTLAEQEPSVWDRVANDPLYAQRCVHETLRLRPTTPKMKRLAEADTSVAGRAIPKGALVILDAIQANQDVSVFGETAHLFDPERELDESVPRWGLSFGAGAHQCPGRTVAAGLPAPTNFEPDDEHLVGLVAVILQEMVRRGVQRDPEGVALPDPYTDRYTNWNTYAVRFTRARSAALVA